MQINILKNLAKFIEINLILGQICSFQAINMSILTNLLSIQFNLITRRFQYVDINQFAFNLIQLNNSQVFNMQSSHVNQENEVFMDPQSSLPKTYFQLIERVGSSGKYQQNIFYIFLLVFLVTGSTLLSTSFLFMNDRYACQQLGLLVQTCKKTICEIQDIEQRQKYFIQNKQKIKSVATDYGPFMCEDEFLLDLLKSCPYFGSFLGFIIFSYISDNFGRKSTMTISLGVATIGCLLIVTGFNLALISIGIILAGAGINASSGMVFYFLGQVVENIKRQKYSILVQCSYTIGAILITGLYYFLHSWRIVSITLQCLPILVTLFLFVSYVEETPLFLLKGPNQKALKALNRIGYINLGIRDILTQEDIQNVRMQQLANQKFNKVRVSPLDLFRFRSLRSTTIVSCLLCYVVFSMYYGPALIIDSIGFDTYVSNLAIQLSQLVGFIPCYYYIEKVKRKKAGFALFLIAIICSFILTLVKKPQGCVMCVESVIQLVVIFFFRFAIATEFVLFLVYIVELFPARVVGLGVGAVNAAGTMASTLSPIILGAMSRVEFNLMLLFLILGIFGIVLTLLLQQTYGKPLKIQIQQVLYAKNKRKTQYVTSIKKQQLISSKKDI